MGFAVHSLCLNTCTLQTGEDKRSKNVSENLESMLLVLTSRENVILYKIQNMESNFLDGNWD